MKQLIPINWDVSNLYNGGRQTNDLKLFINKVTKQLDELTYQISCVSSLTETNFLSAFIEEIQYIMKASLEIDDFIICLESEHGTDSYLSQLMSESSVIKKNLDTTLTLFGQKLANISQQDWNLLLQNESIKPHTFYLNEKRNIAKSYLPLPEEKIINTLSVNGFIAWEDYYEQLFDKLSFEIEEDGNNQTLSVGQLSHLSIMSEDREKRKKYANLLKDTLVELAPSAATIFNHLSGFRLDVYKLRGWDNQLKEMLDQNRIQHETVAIMMEVIKKERHIFQRFFERKAKLSNLKKLSWYDLYNSHFTSYDSIPYEDAATLVISQFNQFSKKMGSFADKAFHDGWIEAENRPDKRPGAFCASMPLSKESRIFLTYMGSYLDIVTIAHELGHGYHNSIIQEEPAFAQTYGTSVAETASTFSENLVVDSAIQNATDLSQKLSILEMKILRAFNYLGNIPIMFEFEQQLYQERLHRKVSEKEMTALLQNLEQELYKDIVDDLNPYVWVAQGHFFSTERAFYSIPYTIGYLFSNGIYALSKQLGSDFPSIYDEILRNSGKMTVEDLGKTYLNKDLKHEDFWYQGILPVKESIHQFIKLTDHLV